MGSISVMAQCMPHESLRRDLQNMCGHFYLKLLLHGVICVKNVSLLQSVSTIFLLSFSFLLLDTFQSTFAQKIYQKNRQ